jgi:type III restriction enzyme
MTPVPLPKKRKVEKAQDELALGIRDADGTQEYNPTPIIAEIRQAVDSWRRLPNPDDWGVTPITAQLLQHWRRSDIPGLRPFFCQVEAVETLIYLTEVARPNTPRGRKFWSHVEGANAMANPELLRLALKLATGAGKTTVMAMLIAWQTLNAARAPNSKRWTKGFLLVAPGITIRDRLRVLKPNDPDSYFRNRDLVPVDMRRELETARIVITNYHAFLPKEVNAVSKGTRAVIEGWRGDKLVTTESEADMVARVTGDLMGCGPILVVNDEAHHCYREKPKSDDTDDLKGDAKAEAKRNNEAARLWISGIEAVNRVIGVRAVYDLSATPFFLQGSGYREGTLFPWVVSDFSLMDAIECGIVKLPRIPVADNIPGSEMPIYRVLWDHIGKDMPKMGKSAAKTLDPLKLPAKLYTALEALYGHYVKTFNLWRQAGIGVPPVFIVVCNNTATSKLVYDYVSGFERVNPDGSVATEFGRLELFRNHDEHGNRNALPQTLLIDSEQLESGDALDKEFQAAAKLEIDQFRRELIERGDERGRATNLSEADLLREVMNTVGRKGRLGEQIRCVVSVSMLTEGWDANTVTHILGLRAFGTQLLCEQVVGRALRRQAYELNADGQFDVEYADILGIPFDFTAKPVPSEPATPRETIRVQAVLPARADLEIRFPRVEGYRIELPEARIEARFSDDSHFTLDPTLVGPSIVQQSGIIGETVDLNVRHLEQMRPSSVIYELTKRFIYERYRDPDGEPKLHLFGKVKTLVRQWFETYLHCVGGTYPAQLLYRDLGDMALNRIEAALYAGYAQEKPVSVVLDAYNPTGSTRFVNFITTRTTRWQTRPDKCQLNWVIGDSDWEIELAQAIERHPAILSYAKMDGTGFEIPYRLGSESKRYRPDFILRVNDGGPEPLNLIAEVKGYRKEDAKAKAETVKNYWLPGVNRLGTFGRWGFVELKSVFEMEPDLDDYLAKALPAKAA